MLKKLSQIFKKSDSRNEQANFSNSLNNIYNYYFNKYNVKGKIEKYIVKYSINEEETLKELNSEKIEFINDSLYRINKQLKNYSSKTLQIEFIDSNINILKKETDNLEYVFPMLNSILYLESEINSKVKDKIDRIKGLLSKFEIEDKNKYLKEIILEYNLDNISNIEIIALINVRDLSRYLFVFERDKNQLLIDHLNELKKNILSGLNQLSNFFDANDIDNIIKYFNTRLSAIPYEHFKNAKESFYNAILGIILFENQINYIDQKHNNIGRSDLIVERINTVYCLELKLNKSTDEALKQIIDKDYLGEYRLHNKKLIGVGLNISSSKRQIDGTYKDIQ